MTVSPELVTARAEAALARERFMHTLGDVQQRLAPATIARNAWENVRDRGEEIAGQTVDLALETAEHTVDFAREKPGAASAVAGLAAAFLIRKPIARGVRRLFRRKPRSVPATVKGSPGVINA